MRNKIDIQNVICDVELRALFREYCWLSGFCGTLEIGLDCVGLSEVAQGTAWVGDCLQVLKRRDIKLYYSSDIIKEADA